MADDTDPKQQTMTTGDVGRKVDTLSQHMDEGFDDARERDRKGGVDTKQNNGRVNMALLGLKIDNLADKVDAGFRDSKEKVDAGFKDSKEDVASLCKRWEEGHEDHEDRLRVVETATTKIESRMTILAGLQAAFTSVTAGLAAWLGVQR